MSFTFGVYLTHQDLAMLLKCFITGQTLSHQYEILSFLQCGLLDNDHYLRTWALCVKSRGYDMLTGTSFTMR